MPAASPTAERHATWLELFFDLVIVAAVAQLAHLLHDGPGRQQVFLFAVLYYAMWSVWTTFTLYANVSGTQTRQRAMLAAMFGIAVMAASVPQVAHGNPAIFVLAYVVCRLLAAGSWKRTSRVMAEWPGVQQAVGVIPWVASLGFAPPARYWLWTAGIVLDVVISVARSRDPGRLVESERRERQRERQHRGWLVRLLHRPEPPPVDVAAAPPDRPHLSERLGLFVIIVLGEAVAQVVNAAADVPDWRRGIWLAVLCGFGLLVALWWLTLRYGSSAAPSYGVPVFALRLTMPGHYLTTAAIVAIAAGLGALADHPDGALPEAERWVLCGGFALYFAVACLLGARGGAARRWLVGWGLPAVLVPVLLGLFGGGLPSWSVGGGLLVVTLWHIAYRRFDPDPDPRPDPDPHAYPDPHADPDLAVEDGRAAAGQ